VTGWTVDGMDEAMCKLGRVLALDRARVRRRFEERFTAARMAKDYVEAYERLIRRPAVHRPDRSLPAILSSPSEIVQ
jgi:hypothetical protein